MPFPRDRAAWKKFALDLWFEVNHDKVFDFAGALAYSGILALFPFLLFVVALAGLMIDPKTVDTLIEQVQRLVPSQVADLLIDRMKALTGARPALLTVGAVGAIWAASGGVTALISALNAVHDVEDRRPFWKVRGLAILVTLGGAALAILTSAIALLSPVVVKILGSEVGHAMLWLRWPVAAVMLNGILSVLYRILPDYKTAFRLVSPGSIVAVVMWILASVGFTVYVAHFGSYEVVYGALGSVIVLLLWMWISSLAVLVGAEVDSVLEHGSPNRMAAITQVAPTPER